MLKIYFSTLLELNDFSINTGNSLSVTNENSRIRPIDSPDDII